MTKELKLKVTKFYGLSCTFVEVKTGTEGGGGFLRTPILNRVKTCYKYVKKCNGITNLRFHGSFIIAHLLLENFRSLYL